MIVVERGDIGVAKEILATGGPVETAQEIHQGRFAAAGGAHNGDEIALMEIHSNPPERFDADRAHLVGFVYIPQAGNHRFGHGVQLLLGGAC